ncbi:MAG: diacylglycerol kinase family lipid kinase [Candidatus Thermoplasmatota archaeon]|nr:diacylglycerol kinase family lipid kinase [Candidatus Thermoplasmatota archaeon]
MNFPKVLCIFNPEAGRGRFRIGPGEIKRRFAEVSRRIGADIEMELIETSVPGDAERIGRENRGGDLDVIAVCGGDGTVYEVINGIAGSGKGFGIVPLGSGNDGIVSITGDHRSIDNCISDIVRCERHSIDIARMNDRLFLNVVGIGMDAAINHEVADRRDLVKRLGPTFLYTYCTFRVIPRWKDMDISLTIDDGQPVERKVKMLTIGNGTTCGGGFRLTPRARMDDGLLDLSLIKTAGIIKTMVNVPKAFKGDHLGIDLTIYRQFRKLSVRSLEDRELPLHIDGEKGFSREFDFQVLPGKIWTVHKPGLLK